MNKSFPRLMVLCAALALTACNRYDNTAAGAGPTTIKGTRTESQLSGDEMLARQVRTVLDNDPAYKFPNVNVAVFKGDVQLSGFAATSDQKGRATDLAKTVSGVRNGENRISVGR